MLMCSCSVCAGHVLLHFFLKYLAIIFSRHPITEESKRRNWSFVRVLVWPQPATKAPRGRPSPRRGAEENGKEQAETGGSG